MKHSMAHSTTWTRVLLTAAAAAAHACAGGDDGSGGAEGAAAGAGGSAAGRAPSAAGTSGATATAMQTNPLFGSCPEDRSPVSCGGTSCAPIDEQATLICTQGCCTPEGTCGTFNAAQGTACVDASGGGGHVCPMETVLGANVPGCCVEGTNLCGVLDITGVIGRAAGADAKNCVLRANVSLLSLAPSSCDGSPVDGASNGGAGGGATAGATGGRGGGTAAGSGGASTGVECPDDTVCAENEFIASQMSGFRFCGSDDGRFGHSPPPGDSQEDCDDGPGGNYQDFAGLIEGCIILCD
jgi:hypothetical protein